MVGAVVVDIVVKAVVAVVVVVVMVVIVVVAVVADVVERILKTLNIKVVTKVVWNISKIEYPPCPRSDCLLLPPSAGLQENGQITVPSKKARRQHSPDLERQSIGPMHMLSVAIETAPIPINRV